MQDVFTLLSGLNEYIIIALIILSIILLIFNISNAHSLSKLKKKHRELMRGAKGENLEEIIKEYFQKVEQIGKESENIKSMYKGLHDEVKMSIKNVAMVRYKAFDNVGSDLSFSLVMLDDNYDGVILTSIYGRGESVVYAKPINKGLSRYDLSDEEKNILKEVCQKNQ
ncbi:MULTISPECIES: DUF4446 family protein [Clostridium]|uniref:DUF4446 family protein n=1 Tax=Clostridium TaxID=1485 RepID=UPI000825266E|nr:MULTISPECIES: DUF4446 family protein [Clostridium]PJI08369.1 DUF4446 domain-containing protein [Clostridium sp. CT7]